MDDLISRQAAIDFIDAGHLVNPNEPRWSDNEVVNFLKSRPSAQRTGRWIPVSERLPEEADGTVLVCMPNESPYNEREQFINAKHNQQVETAHYSQYSDTWYFAMGAVSETRPVAWMPLPEPYEKEQE